MKNNHKNSVPCTVAILTFNSEKSLRKSIDPIKHFSEIILCDGGSSDKTLDIAREYGCRIIYQDQKYKYPNNKISDFGGVRNQCFEIASNDWFLYVDSDEILSDELVEEVSDIVERDDKEFGSYKTPRKYILETGEVVERASTYPNYQVRFFRRSATVGFIKKIHEKVKLKEGEREGVLKNVQYVPLDSIENLVKKWDYYNRIQSDGLKRRKMTFGYLIKKIKAQLIKFLKRIIKYLYALLFKKGKMMPFKYEYYDAINHLRKIKDMVSIYFVK